MPEYIVTAPNGFKLKLTGDVPPTDAELDEIFAQYSDSENIKDEKNFDDIQKEGKLKRTSPLNVGDRLGMAFGNPEGNFAYLKRKYRDENVRPKGSSFEIFDKGVWRPSDPSGFGSDSPMDALEFLSSILIPSVATAGGALAGGAVSSPTIAGVPAGVVVGGAAGSAAGEAINEGIGKIAGTRGDLSPLEILLAGGIGGAAPIVGSVASKAVQPIAKNIKQGVKMSAAKISAGLQSDKTADVVAAINRVLTSVPDDFSKKALDKELSGQSLFNLPFNPKDPYAPAREAFIEAKKLIKPLEPIEKKYEFLRNEVVKNINDLGSSLGEKVQDAVHALPAKNLNSQKILDELNEIVEKAASGSSTNPYKEEAGRDIANMFNVIEEAATDPSGKGLLPMDLHKRKELFYEDAYKAGANADTTKEQALRELADYLNTVLRSNSRTYASANDKYATLKKALDRASNINDETLAVKLKTMTSSGGDKGLLETNFRELEKLLPKEKRFVDKAFQIADEIDAEKRLYTLHAKNLEKNPISLKKLTEQEQKAFEELEKRYSQANLKTNNGKPVKSITENIDDMEVRKAFENLLPGQGGGSGTPEGAANLLRGGLGVTSGGLGFLAFSPKLSAKNIIRGIGGLNKGLENIYSEPLETASKKELPETLKRAYQGIISGLANKGAKTMLQGGIEYNDYQ